MANRRAHCAPSTLGRRSFRSLGWRHLLEGALCAPRVHHQWNRRVVRARRRDEAHGLRLIEARRVPRPALPSASRRAAGKGAPAGRVGSASSARLPLAAVVHDASYEPTRVADGIRLGAAAHHAAVLGSQLATTVAAAVEKRHARVVRRAPQSAHVGPRRRPARSGGKRGVRVLHLMARPPVSLLPTSIWYPRYSAWSRNAKASMMPAKARVETRCDSRIARRTGCGLGTVSDLHQPYVAGATQTRDATVP